ncbi:glycine cleavage system H protein [Homoserinimonas aerilata]|uniref:Glycine cleavage system H protein n=1 Tax=Homoserinimonas aerilata TaxID=1162970 RepID=A0A542YGW9_9MICO|nr:glycine cleavage system protein GcvH [Homoserinimonas aerilata]TQL47330.1 glycine cleavage system H protein [Homoserinimonas aerilata]
MSNTPENVQFTAEHEWARIDGDLLTVGITVYAADKLGEVVYVDLPEAGATVARGAVIAEVESTKSVGEIFAPVDGTIVEVNSAVVDSPELINDSPQGDGWLFTVRVAGDDAIAAAGFMDAEAYAALTEA